MTPSGAIYSPIIDVYIYVGQTPIQQSGLRFKWSFEVSKHTSYIVLGVNCKITTTVHSI